MGFDKMIPKHVYHKSFTIRFPDRSEWNEGFQADRKGGPIWYTDGSKINKGTGAVVYCYGTGRNLVLTLGSKQQYSRQKCMPLRYAQLSQPRPTRRPRRHDARDIIFGALRKHI
jgi:hypothetical protein